MRRPPSKPFASHRLSALLAALLEVIAVKLPRKLDPVEIRVLGALLEKEQTTPEYYPLTLNALIAACNQKSNRDPVMQLEPRDVIDAIERLSEDVFVWQLSGSRADRWRHNLDRRWELDGASKALMTLLLLRGPQTPGELRGRAERMFPFSTTDQVEAALETLAAGDEPMTIRLQRLPGQKEARWMHLAAGEEGLEEAAETAASSPISRNRLAELEERVARLETEIAELRELLS